jgi:hypothetical protein
MQKTKFLFLILLFCIYSSEDIADENSNKSQFSENSHLYKFEGINNNIDSLLETKSSIF